MQKIPQVVLSILLLSIFSNCNGQRNSTAATAIVGGGCDGCELMFVGIPTDITSVEYSPNWKASGQKLLVTGTVYQLDGETPASDVILYYWQTDEQGFYSSGIGKSARHGYIRGWVKTDKQGNYAIYTNRPAPYPKQDMPAHIHISVKEPSINEPYYIDEFVFNDDPLLTNEQRKLLENRGGSGILRPDDVDGLQVAKHNIFLGLNIPHYPKN